MSQLHSFVGELSRPPFGDKVTPATTRVIPLRTANDFAALRQLLGPEPGTPFLVSFGEKYALLNAVVQCVFESLSPVDLCLMTAQMPSSEPLPARLLQPDVFLCDCIDAERQRLLDEGRAFVTIDEAFARHSLEYGDNRIRIDWHAPVRNDGDFAKLAERLRLWNIEPIK